MSYRVLWDNGHACGALAEVFETEEAAEARGRDWQAEMVAATPGATDEDYTYEVAAETADEYHARTGEPWGAGEDTFERAMRARYPERSQ